jgi:predicted permease
MAFGRFFRRSRWDDERARELEAHLEIETADNIGRGMAPKEAREAARRKLGNITRIREDIYLINTIGLVDNVWRDLRYGARLLRLNPGFATVAILSLALGVGANTAIFQLLDAVRLRTLPVTRPEQLVDLRIPGDDNRSGAFMGLHPSLTNPLWERLRDRQQAFSGVFAWGSTAFELSAGGESREAEGLWVSGDYFRTLGVQPVIGRLLVADDDRRGCAAPAAVISYGFWQREYGGSRSAVGRAISLDGYSYDIVGVTPPSFFGVEVGRSYDVAVPLCAEPYSRGLRSSLDRKEAWFLAVMGRLKPDWTAEKATAHLKTLAPDMFRETLPNYNPENTRQYLASTLAAFPAQTGVSNLRSDYESPLWLLLATTVLVLLIACANLANLMLARATAREREIAVRLALGAPRGRIVRQLTAESLLIAAAGSAAGAVLALWLSRLFVASLATEDDRVFVALASDWRGFSFIALLAAGTCLIFGVIPAIRATATSPGAAMKAGSRGTTDSRERFGLRRVLVVAQVALSLVLVVGALLFAGSLRNIVTADAGFTHDAILVATIDFRRAGIAEANITATHTELLARLRRQPPVEDAAQVRVVPVSGSFSDRLIIVNGVERREKVNRNAVSDRYFKTMNTAMLAGRDFDARDGATAAKVAVVTESFARVFYGGHNPVGRTFQVVEAPGQPRPIYEIVGLARDSKYGDLRASFESLMFVPAAQDDPVTLTQRLVIRTADVTNTTAAMTAIVRTINPAIVVTYRTMQAQVRDSLLRERLMATLSGFFGGLAAVIAVIGLYGVMSYFVVRRRNEIGIRIALGADRREVVRMVMREAASLVAAGLIAGTIAALLAGRTASTLLFGLKPHDPLILATAITGLILVAAVASFVPAWRASRLEPSVALRED